MLFGKSVNRYYFKYGIIFLIGIGALIAVDFYQLEIPAIIGQIIDGLRYNTLTETALSTFMFRMMGIVGIMFVGRFLWRITIFGNGIRIEADMRERMFIHSTKLSQSYYQENKVGAQMALYTNDLGAIRMAFGEGTLMLVDATFLGILAFTRMWKMDILLTLISSVPLLIVAVMSNIIGRVIRQKFEARQKSFAEISDFTQESFSGITVIKAFVKETKELMAFSKLNQDYMDKNITFVRAGTILRILIGALVSAVTIIILGYGGYLIYSGATLGDGFFTIGRLTEYLAYFGTLTWPMMAIARLINLRSQAQASLKRVDALLNQDIEIKDHDNVIRHHDIVGAITFNNLTFTYPQAANPALKDIRVHIKAGEHVGIIGRTGCGKTTLVDLLLRIYNLESNQLLIDGIDIMRLPVHDVREAIAYVPQDNFLFSDTILNNIGFYTSHADEALVKEAARLADVDENINEFTQKYETILGERGVTVSGGQKQRISIARALVKKAPILILDDSVSAVDTKTEETILHHLKATRKNKTTILIAHRISTIQSMDKILLLDEGCLVGVGTHETLLETNPLYQNMVRLQRLEDEVEGKV